MDAVLVGKEDRHVERNGAHGERRPEGGAAARAGRVAVGRCRERANGARRGGGGGGAGAGRLVHGALWALADLVFGAGGAGAREARASGALAAGARRHRRRVGASAVDAFAIAASVALTRAQPMVAPRAVQVHRPEARVRVVGVAHAAPAAAAERAQAEVEVLAPDERENGQHEAVPGARHDQRELRVVRELELHLERVQQALDIHVRGVGQHEDTPARGQDRAVLGAVQLHPNRAVLHAARHVTRARVALVTAVAVVTAVVVPAVAAVRVASGARVRVAVGQRVRAPREEEQAKDPRVERDQEQNGEHVAEDERDEHVDGRRVVAERTGVAIRVEVRGNVGHEEHRERHAHGKCCGEQQSHEHTQEMQNALVASSELDCDQTIRGKKDEVEYKVGIDELEKSRGGTAQIIATEIPGRGN